MTSSQATVQFMLGLQGSPEEHMFSRLIPKQALGWHIEVFAFPSGRIGRPTVRNRSSSDNS